MDTSTESLLTANLPPDQELIDEVIEEKQEVTQQPDGKTIVNNYKTITKTIKLKPICTRKHLMPELDEQLSIYQKQIKDIQTEWTQVKTELDAVRGNRLSRILVEGMIIAILSSIFYSLYEHYGQRLTQYL